MAAIFYVFFKENDLNIPSISERKTPIFYAFRREMAPIFNVFIFEKKMTSIFHVFLKENNIDMFVFLKGNNSWYSPFSSTFDLNGLPIPRALEALPKLSFHGSYFNMPFFKDPFPVSGT